MESGWGVIESDDEPTNTTLAAVVAELSAAQERAAQLERALESSRHIVMAIGILLERYEMTAQQAFKILARASQDANRKLVDVARDC